MIQVFRSCFYIESSSKLADYVEIYLNNLNNFDVNFKGIL